MIKSAQLGGKGTMRRKKKRVNTNNFKCRKTEKGIIYEKKINNINKIINEINDEDYDKFKMFLDSELEDLSFSIAKNDLRKNNKKDMDEIKDDSLNYIYNLLIKDIDKPLKLNEKNYENIKKKFEEDFMDIIIEFINELESNLLRKDYILNKKDDSTGK